MRPKDRDDAMAQIIQCSRQSQIVVRGEFFFFCRRIYAYRLHQTCLTSDRLKTASSYLLVLHNLEQLDENSSDAIRLLRSAVDAKDWQLCKELLRFLHSIDDTGTALRNALAETNLVELPNGVANGAH